MQLSRHISRWIIYIAYWPNWKGGWSKCDTDWPLKFWNLYSNGRVIKRGIFKIRVVED